MAEDRNDRTRESEHTTIIQTDSGGRGGGGAATVLVVVLVIVLIAVLLLFAFGDWLGGAAEEIDVPENIGVDVNINEPDLQVPDVEPPAEEPASEPAGNAS